MLNTIINRKGNRKTIIVSIEKLTKMYLIYIVSDLFTFSWYYVQDHRKLQWSYTHTILIQKLSAKVCFPFFYVNIFGFQIEKR